MKKCLYCGVELPENSVVDFCERCGVNVFGRKMFNAIVDNMNKARANNNLCHNINISDFSKT